MAEKIINGVTYSCTQLTADPGLALLLRCLKLGAPLAQLFQEGDSTNDDGGFFLRALTACLTDLDAAGVHRLCLDLVKLCKADGEPVVVGVKPAGTLELLQVAAFCLEVQFGDFFGEDGASFVRQAAGVAGAASQNKPFG